MAEITTDEALGYKALMEWAAAMRAEASWAKPKKAAPQPKLQTGAKRARKQKKRKH